MKCYKCDRVWAYSSPYWWWLGGKVWSPPKLHWGFSTTLDLRYGDELPLRACFLHFRFDWCDHKDLLQSFSRVCERLQAIVTRLPSCHNRQLESYFFLEDLHLLRSQLGSRNVVISKISGYFDCLLHYFTRSFKNYHVLDHQAEVMRVISYEINELEYLNDTSNGMLGVWGSIDTLSVDIIRAHLFDNLD